MTHLYSIVIPTRNRAPQLRTVLGQLAAQRDAPAHEVIVVDNASTDDTPAVVRAFPSVRYVAAPWGGTSRARNVGIEHATGDVIACTDDDAGIPETWLASHDAAYALCPDAWLLGGPVRLMEKHLPEWFYRTHLPPNALFGPSVDHGDGEGVKRLAFPQFLGGPNMLIPRATLDRLGGFREDIGYRPGRAHLYAEDWEYCHRVYDAGGSLYYCPKAHVYHPVRADRRSLRGTRRAFFIYGRQGVLSASFPPCSPVVAAKDVVLSIVRYARRDFGGGLRHELAARRAAGYFYQRLLGPNRVELKQ